MIDQCLPTIEVMTERRPDLVVKCQKRKLGIIFEVACAWDPLDQKRETQKKRQRTWPNNGPGSKQESSR